MIRTRCTSPQLLLGLLWVATTLLPFATMQAQRPHIERIDPPHWFEGMVDQKLQLVVYGEHVGNAEVEVSGVARLDSVVRVPNLHYLFVYVSLDGLAGEIALKLSVSRKSTTHYYKVLEKDFATHHISPLSTSDFMYLLMPDRFANGDAGNDSIVGMNETSLNRSEMYARHGGDIQGVIDHLDYLEDLGVTALWLNPVLENDEPKASYHGYATTDSYAIDRRFGTNALYCALGDSLRGRGMKLVKDVIYNHWGDQHWMLLDPPDSTWVNPFPDFTRTNHRPYTLFDPYASTADKHIMTDGWFDHHMPDLNQRNPLLADYLMQNTLWWIAEAGLDGLRIDTYYYPDQAFMSALVKRVRSEFPGCFVFGECWINDPVALNWVATQSPYRGMPDTELQSVTDFPLYFATLDALNQGEGWESGSMRWYITLANDVVLPYRPDHVLFLDNHDLSRYYSMVGEDFEKYKVGIAFLMTTRGIPMLYYGTEVLMKNYCDPDGKVRLDFPGGWPEDDVNKFDASGRTALEQEAHTFVKNLANWRLANSWLGESELLHFIPQDGVYVYFRFDQEHKVMVVLNPQDKQVTVDLGHYSEMVLPGETFTNARSQTAGTLKEQLRVDGKSSLILELNQQP